MLNSNSTSNGGVSTSLLICEKICSILFTKGMIPFPTTCKFFKWIYLFFSSCHSERIFKECFFQATFFLQHVFQRVCCCCFLIQACANYLASCLSIEWKISDCGKHASSPSNKQGLMQKGYLPQSAGQMSVPVFVPIFFARAYY